MAACSCSPGSPRAVAPCSLPLTPHPDQSSRFPFAHNLYPWLSFWGGSGPCSAAHRLVSPQAELRALEEGDGSVSGSSPLSDGSQSASQDATRRLASKRGKWKLFVGAASPESTSRGSSKTGRESPEAGEAGNSKGSLRRREARVFGKAAALSHRGIFPPKMRLTRSP